MPRRGVRAPRDRGAPKRLLALIETEPSAHRRSAAFARGSASRFHRFQRATRSAGQTPPLAHSGPIVRLEQLANFVKHRYSIANATRLWAQLLVPNINSNKATQHKRPAAAATRSQKLASPSAQPPLVAAWRSSRNAASSASRRLARLARLGGARRRPAPRRAHSMMSSARTKRSEGSSTPIALAVRRFTASSNFVGCWIGRSPAFAPRAIRSTYWAASSHIPGRLTP